MAVHRTLGASVKCKQAMAMVLFLYCDMHINTGNTVLVDIPTSRKAVTDADLILKPLKPPNGRNISSLAAAIFLQY